MDAEVIALLGGLLFLLLALVGGGFTVKEIIMPTIPKWARAACLLVGITLVVLSIVTFTSRPQEVTVTEVGASAASPQATATPSPTSVPAPGFPFVIYEDSSESTAAEHGIQVSGIRASAPNASVGVGEQILVEFSLTNVGAAPVTFEETFIGRRTPSDEWADTGAENQGAVLEPGAVLDVSVTVPFEAPGQWKLWPCYTLDAGGEACPDEWQRFFVTVE